jgi:hypothetical protein
VRYLQTYKLFESVNDDVYEKWAKVKSDYDKGIEEIKAEYLKGVSDCLLDLTDYYEYTSKVEIRDFSKSDEEYWKFIGNVNAKFKFEVPIDKVEEFMDTLIELDELVKSHISKHRRIVVEIFDIVFTRLHRLETYSLENVKSKVMDVLNEPRTVKDIKNSQINFATIEIEI